MKRIVLLLVVISAFAIAIAGDSILDSFKATNSSDIVNIEWRTNSESGVSYFEIERLAASGFIAIGNQKANGKASNYKFTDADCFTKDSQGSLQSSSVATYRLKIIYSSNSRPPTYSDEVPVVRNVNSIKRTLGMLKEMFK
jgi:hypothetical protein